MKNTLLKLITLLVILLSSVTDSDGQRLRSMVGVNGQKVYAYGIDSLGDGKNSFYLWSDTCMAVDDGYFFIRPDGVQNGCWIRQTIRYDWGIKGSFTGNIPSIRVDSTVVAGRKFVSDNYISKSGIVVTNTGSGNPTWNALTTTLNIPPNNFAFAAGFASIPLIAVGGTVNVTVPFSSGTTTMPNTNYLVVSEIDGVTISVLGNMTVQPSIKNATSVVVQVKNNGLLSIAAGAVVRVIVLSVY